MASFWVQFILYILNDWRSGTPKQISLGDWIYKMILYVTLKAWKICKSPESLWTGYFVLPLIQPYSFLNYIKTILSAQVGTCKLN